MGIKHGLLYRPQTDGKVERFCGMLNEDLIEGTNFEILRDLKGINIKHFFGSV